MNIEYLKQNIIDYNTAYRTGNAIVSDFVFDIALDELKSGIPAEEYNSFIRTLTEESGDKSHAFVIGSLNKIKADEPEELAKWIKKNNITDMFVSDKIDGCSIVCTYDRGHLIACSSRGDGNTGTDWLDKAKHILPVRIDYEGQLVIRGEVTLHHESLSVLNFKNTRNGTTGLMNSNEVDVEKLKHIHAYFYEVLSHDWNPETQFQFLIKQGFNIAQTYIINSNYEHQLNTIYNEFSDNASYCIDGLVISSTEYKREDVFYPQGKIAYKINESGTSAKVIDVEWELSKNRILKPVLILNPVELNGTTVTRCTANNALWLQDRGLGKGAEILLIKSGMVIPKCIEVIKPADELELPLLCPECNKHLEWKGVELQCNNISCGEVKRIEAFIKNIGIDKVSYTTLLNWGITTFDKLINWTPDTKLKSQVDFYNQLDEKVFNNTQLNIMRSFSYDGMGQTNFDKLSDHFGGVGSLFDLFGGNIINYTLPVGIGEKSIEKASSDWYRNYQILERLTMDHRWQQNLKEVREEPKMSTTSKVLEGKSFLFTGKLSQVRSFFEQCVSENGGINGTVVNKNLSYLVCGGDSWNTSSKFKKAEKLNIQIITEDEFVEMIK